MKIPQFTKGQIVKVHIKPNKASCPHYVGGLGTLKRYLDGKKVKLTKLDLRESNEGWWWNFDKDPAGYNDTTTEDRIREMATSSWVVCACMLEPASLLDKPEDWDI